MRTFTVRKGSYTGEHIIWDSVAEAEAHKITDIQSPWYNDNVKQGSWCVADDGYVLECLNRRTLVNKRHRQGQHTDTFRFATGTPYVYYGINGKRHISSFYGGSSQLHKNSMTVDSGELGKYLTIRKKLFCTLIAGGMDPYHAFQKAYSAYTHTTSNIINYKVKKLLADKYVRIELMEQLKPFMEKVAEDVKAKTGYESLKDFIASKIVEVATDTDASNKDKMAMIKLMIDLFGVQLGILAPKTEKKNLEEIQQANYETVEPPTLSQSTS